MDDYEIAEALVSAEQVLELEREIEVFKEDIELKFNEMLEVLEQQQEAIDNLVEAIEEMGGIRNPDPPYHLPQ